MAQGARSLVRLVKQQGRSHSRRECLTRGARFRPPLAHIRMKCIST
jgi:hypothetical protein